MDFRKHRLLIACFALLALVGALVALQKQREAEFTAGAEGEESPLPTLTRDSITSVEIRRPEQPVVRLDKSGSVFNVAVPVTAPSDSANVSSLLDKLVGLEFVSIASRSRSSHAQLEVDAAHSIHVIAKAGNRTAIDIHIGIYRGGNTMVRLEGSNDVLAVSGSIRFAFARELHEWRDRVITEVTPGDVRVVTFTSDQGTFRFERNTDGEWVGAAGQAAIPRFEANKVDAIVSSLARLRATNFGADTVAPEANFAAPRGTVTLHVQQTATEDGGVGRAEDITLLLGAAREATNDTYVQRQGNPTIFVGPGFLTDRMRPNAAAFQADVPVDGGVPAAPAEPEGMPPEMLGGGGGGQQIPPEVLRQLMQQAQQQGGH